MSVRTKTVTVNSSTPTRLDFTEGYYTSDGAPKVRGSTMKVVVGDSDIYVSGSDSFTYNGTGDNAPSRWAAGETHIRDINRQDEDAYYALTASGTSVCEIEQSGI